MSCRCRRSPRGPSRGWAATRRRRTRRVRSPRSLVDHLLDLEQRIPEAHRLLRERGGPVEQLLERQHGAVDELVLRLRVLAREIEAGFPRSAPGVEGVATGMDG